MLWVILHLPEPFPHPTPLGVSEEMMMPIFTLTVSDLVENTGGLNLEALLLSCVTTETPSLLTR